MAVEPLENSVSAPDSGVTGAYSENPIPTSVAQVVADANVAALKAKVVELATELASLRMELERSRKRVRVEAEKRAELRRAAGRFAEAFDYRVSIYRGQRAWKVMLQVSRAYAMLTREGWRGAWRLLLGRRWSLDEFEPAFPLIRKYLPLPDNHDGPEQPEVGLSRGAPHKFDVIVLAVFDFDFRFQRPQQLASQLAREGHRVFWVASSRVVPAESKAPYYAIPVAENIWEVQLRGVQFDIYHDVPEEETIREFCANLRHLYRDYTVSETMIHVQLPFWRRFGLNLRREPASTLIYDCMDNWDTFDNLGDFNHREEPLLAAECDLLVVTADKLREKFAAQGRQALLVRNAADFKSFQNAEPLPEVAKLPKPVVGFYGGIADWVDLDLVYEVAKARPQYTFVMAGQVHGRDMSKLRSLSNVQVIGMRPYNQMPPLLASFDACMIPFVLNEVTNATDPVKLYEYLSQGKPVVATDMSELRPYSELLYLARGAAQFAEQVDRAVTEAVPELRARRVEFARLNSWPARVAALKEGVRGTWPKVSILVVTYNSAQYVRPCLRSLLRNTSYPNFEAIVVDNASQDDSAAAAEEVAASDPRIRVIRQAKNLGFAGGNNVAAAAASGDYLIFLNADTLVTPGWIGFLLRHVVADPSIGLICPVTNFAGNEAKINIDYLDELEMEDFAIKIAREKRGSSFDVSSVPLFCALMRREVFQAVGGLDESFEVGMFEDDDLALSVRKQGLRTCVAEDCFIHHFGQGSFSALPTAEYESVFAKNRRRFEGKWSQQWAPHKTRPTVRPVEEDRRHTPEAFCGQSGS